LWQTQRPRSLLWEAATAQPRLDFARDFEVALHDDFVREFQGKQEQEISAAKSSNRTST